MKGGRKRRAISLTPLSKKRRQGRSPKEIEIEKEIEKEIEDVEYTEDSEERGEERKEEGKEEEEGEKEREGGGEKKSEDVLPQHFIAQTTRDLDATFMENASLNIATLSRENSVKLQAVSVFFQDLIDTYSDMPSFAKEAMDPSFVRKNVEDLYNTFFEENSGIMTKETFFTPERAIVFKWMLDDIEKMAKVFLRVTKNVRKKSAKKGKKIKFTLKGVNENGCELFHQDYVPVRMLVSYLGPATEWVPNSAVDWAFLKNPKSVITNERLIKNYPVPIRRIPTNDLLIMKGAININRKPKKHKA
eukprot:Phypoly_transcript_04134.p1 GENE.Phypoly_transcript_04134~~Phypoly_transcript_04134.p1  ORF type:complete len:303 (+),score=74.41 Phypoly_transcript_04134:203-1111(+)